MASFGSHLINEILPLEHQGKGPLTKAKLNSILVDIAKKTPELYPDIVTKLKRLGDEIATLDGVSVGIVDLDSDKLHRDALLAPFVKDFKTTKNKDQVLLDAQAAMLAHAKANKSVFGEMVRSGGRGNAAQLMRITSAPVFARDEKDQIVPWMITRSYAEGLKPSDAWVAGNEARINAIKSNIAVVEPGDLAKILINNMGDKLVTMVDCGTHNGLSMSTSDPAIVDRYLASSPHTLLTPRAIRDLPKDGHVLVRSPMTCEAPHGVCQKCQGLDAPGHAYPIGTNVGVRAAQALSEPLTQFALNAKHGGRLSSSKDQDAPGAQGLKGVRQMLEIPQSFLHKATLAEHDGTVGKIETAPQGGTYAWVDGTRHYISPDLRAKVRTGQHVEAGDALSSGVPKPDEIVKHKGLGVGRQYLVNALDGIYKAGGTDVDRRHLEILAKSVLNYVQVADPGDESSFIKGDVIDFNRYHAAVAANAKSVPLHDSVGEVLGKNLLHFTAGTRITPSVKDELAKRNIQHVDIADHAPMVEPFMKPATRTPLLRGDWLQRLAHRYLKESLVAGAHKGDVSDLHGYSPVPGYAAGAEFGEGEDGKY